MSTRTGKVTGSIFKAILPCAPISISPPGVRYDQVGDFDPAFNPRLALIYNPFTKSTFKAIYGSAFRAPNFSELSDPRFQDIQPEQITSYELVYEQEIGRYLRSTVSGFYNQMNDLIVFQSGNFNNMDADTTGMELALEGRWASGIRGQVSYSLQDTRNKSLAWDMPDSPKQMVKLNLSVPIFPGQTLRGSGIPVHGQPAQPPQRHGRAGSAADRPR